MIDLRRWPALVLTAGLATRLRPLSDVRAKAAMPVAGATIVARILTWLQAAGIRHVVLNLHHRPESIASIVGDGSAFGVEVRYSWEHVVLGSAGGPRHALELLDADRFFVVNGDTLTDCDLATLAACHLQANARVTMALVPGDVGRYGGVLVDDDGRVRGFGKSSQGLHALHFIGVQAVEASVFSSLRDDEPAETVRGVYPRLLAQQPDAIAAFESGADFLDVGTARDYLSTVATVAARERQPFDVGANCRIAPDAQLERTVVWDRVTIGAGARLTDCIVADDVTIHGGASYHRRILIHTPAGPADFAL